MNKCDYVMTCLVGSNNMSLWKNINGTAEIIKSYISTIQADILQKEHGIKWIRNSRAQKWFNNG